MANVGPTDDYLLGSVNPAPGLVDARTLNTNVIVNVTRDRPKLSVGQFQAPSQMVRNPLLSRGQAALDFITAQLNTRLPVDRSGVRF